MKIPVFYDKLERARVQATDRIAMIHAIGALIQQFIVAASLSASIFWFSPWLLLLLIVAVVPAFLGRKPLCISRLLVKYPADSRAAATGLFACPRRQQRIGERTKAFRPWRFHHRTSTRDSRMTFMIRTSRLRAAGCGREPCFRLLSTAGYYGAFAYVVYRTVSGDLSWGTLQFLAGAIAGASNNIQTIFSTFSSIADQSLFLDGSGRVLPGPANGTLQTGRHSRAAGRFGTASFSMACRSPIRAAPAAYLTI